MTNDEFNSKRLSKRVEFKLIEAARFILVHKIDFKLAMTLSGLNEVGDDKKLEEVILMFKSDF